MQYLPSIFTRNQRKTNYPRTWDRQFSRTLHHAMLAVGIALVAGAAMVAQAQTAAEVQPAAPLAAPAPAVAASAAGMHGQLLGPKLTIRDVYDRLEKQGYRDFREIEWDDGRYKVKAVASDGRAVKIHMDGRSGSVLGIRHHRY